MTKNSEQLWQLELHGRNLKYGRLDATGDVRWAKVDWKIRGTSLLPRGLFFTVTSFVLRRVKELRDKSFSALEEAILWGLREAAVACGCTWKVKSVHGDLVWILDGHRFFAFQVVDFHRHGDAKLADLRALLRKRRPRFKKMERKSRSLFRASLVLLKGDFVKFVPGKTRRN